MNEDPIREAYELACIDGRFISDSYSQPAGLDSKGNPKEILLHSVVFIAYDGYHMGRYFDTKELADKAAAEINSLHSIEAVDEYFQKLLDKAK